MARQNIYDNDIFFEGYSKIRERKNNANELFEKPALFSLVPPLEGKAVIDLGCGYGEHCMEYIRRGAASVVGIDISEKMLEIGQKKVDSLKYEERMKISFSKSSAESIVFNDNVFDAVLVAFGVRNFSDREKGLKEILRVLKPKGTLVILELSEPQNVIVRWFYNLYFKHIMPTIGKRVSGNAYAYRYLQQTVEKFPMPKEFMPLLAGCGYKELKHKALSCGLCRIYQAKKA